MDTLRPATGVRKSLLALWLLGASVVGAAEIEDVCFSTPYAVGRPTTANFYYNGRAIGPGRAGFAAIVELIGKLPAGTSIVWGPNYARCGSCSGTEPKCVPKFLYPDLWEELETSIQERQLVVSSDYPGPVPMAVGFAERDAMPAALSPADPAAKERFDAVLDWEVGRIESKREKPLNRPIARGAHRSRFSSGGEALAGYDLALFFGRLPIGARVLIQLESRDKMDFRNEDEDLLPLGKDIRAAWKADIGKALRRGKLTAVLTAPPNLAQAVRIAAKQVLLTIDWTNFHGPQTRHDEIIYEVNGRFVGSGDEGFDRILAQIDKLSPSTEAVIPRYEYSGRWALERYSREELDAKNAQLRDVVPFAARSRELDAQIAKRRLSVSFSRVSPAEDENAGTVLAWGSGDRWGQAFVSFGRIVRFDEQPRPAAARLAWIRYQGGGIDENGKVLARQVETEAFYTLNDVELGQGVSGFAQAMKRLAALPEGSVVHVSVCLRTKGPFTCPLIYQGHRHFERTGFEPYFGMFPWLIDVARKRKLEIQWIPDERESCRDCELNM